MDEIVILVTVVSQARIPRLKCDKSRVTNFILQARIIRDADSVD